MQVVTVYAISAIFACGGVIAALVGWQQTSRRFLAQYWGLIGTISIMLGWGLMAWLVDTILDMHLSGADFVK